MFVTLLCIFPVPAAGIDFSGSMGLENEQYKYSTEADVTSRTRQRALFDLKGRGYIWDPRFMVYKAGVALQREKVQNSAGQTSTSSLYNMVGYHLNTTFLTKKPNPLTLYASRNKSTVHDFWSPSYGYTTNNLGARWGINKPWLGRSSLYFDRTSSQSDNALVPRSDWSLQLGTDVNKKLRPKQWGESDLSYGYRRTEQEDRISGSTRRQNYFYLNDHSSFGKDATLSSNLAYFKHNDKWGYSGNTVESTFLGFSNSFSMQQTEDFRHYYGLGLSLSDSGTSKSRTHNLSAGTNYRFNQQWQMNGTVASSNSNTRMPDNTQQNNKSLTSLAALMYTDTFLKNYLINGGYSVSRMQTQRSVPDGVYENRSTAQAVNLGYSRMNSLLYADSLQLSMSRLTGEPSGNEFNTRYNVRSRLTQNDLLQAGVDYRRYHQSKTVVNSTTSAPDDIYDSSSRSKRFNISWSHRFLESGSGQLSATTSRNENQGFTTTMRSIQAIVRKSLGAALHWSMTARKDHIEGLESMSGNRTTVESDMDYQIGKWQATARYRYRDVQQHTAPFKEHSITFTLKRIYGFRL